MDCSSKIRKDLVLILGLNETMDLLAMANGVHWYGDVLRSKDGHYLRRVLDFII